MADSSSLIFISGGVRSGKSSFAEKIAADEAALRKAGLHYIATAQISDTEMKERVAHHRTDRLNSGHIWKTWEQPVRLLELANSFDSHDIVLLDCLTTLLNNEFFKADMQWKDHLFQECIIQSILAGITQIKSNCQLLIIVSNEVLNDSTQNNELVLTYQKMLGELHQHIVSMAEQAFLVESGIPLAMKGADCL
ncbi:bifunctional adenosylcobinamide kinase/adenosylcobinamide-phosphate guanylyltransferase [Mesobacillus harenae]|uniref:bifunctional adenosylcobinamide kinase/adenosylcobinamide-phosphate guanylyltransferase n=1 Tax=Mesobacillus harenae TaxID=2213203 RepID=UPI001580BA32|nr:bifunctional adenosylcobinamide kinase/adenosylcobinamide-phosphate guanylyltransferase [Mesobacillus harenae]